jgi:hypothetical protein
MSPHILHRSVDTHAHLKLVDTFLHGIWFVLLVPKTSVRHRPTRFVFQYQRGGSFRENIRKSPLVFRALLTEGSVRFDLLRGYTVT